MSHKPIISTGKDLSGPYKIHLGVRLFIAYSLFYAGFVAINLLNPQMMAKILFAGLNLATIYGFALIIVALLEALAYDRLCRKKEAFYMKDNESKGKGGK
jgi:hypothetical protein